MSKIYGETTGLRKSILNRLEDLYTFTVPFGQIITNELVQSVVELSLEVNREIALYLNRRGQITAVAIGNIYSVELPKTNGRYSERRLSGIRCIHTHPNNNPELSAVDVSSLKEMRFDIMAAVAKSNNEYAVSFSFISHIYEDTFQTETIGPISIEDFIRIDLNYLTSQIERKLEADIKSKTVSEAEYALLVGVEQTGQWDIEESLKELAQLAETAGAQVVGTTWQKRQKPDAALFIGQGKAQEINMMRQELNANVIIFDDELSPAQQRNLEQLLGIKILDRTALILDIFAQRARSHEGKLQVELAQLKYTLPRLGGQGLILSRLGGGIGTRGPGETKLEVDKRRIRGRISDIEKQIELIKRQRHLHRARRHAARIPTIALVGYTNAGKSTLLNTLTNAEVLAEDKLFATLDPTTRIFHLPAGEQALLTDTVGFIQKIPHHLVAAFRATLEEVVQADVLLHVIDASHPQYEQQSDAVFHVLRDLKADTKPLITVFNKIDKISNHNVAERLQRLDHSVAISAVKGIGLTELLHKIEEFVRPRTIDMKLLIPYNDSSIMSTLYDTATVHSVEYCETGVLALVSLLPEQINRFNAYIAGDEQP